MKQYAVLVGGDYLAGFEGLFPWSGHRNSYMAPTSQAARKFGFRGGRACT